ncbi:MAG: CooT family nickel-binding protein [Clostridiales Family XIII bacterium]|jgi:predicted RNA-binding protein|nr:CooT family nickel-binding protein [Clostridiales Family XIII bacterium]
MCLSTVYALENDGGQTLLCEYVSAVKVCGKRLVFTDITGEETDLPGSIRGVDLVKNTITVSREDA